MAEGTGTQTKCIAAIKRACSNLGYEADVVSQGHTGNITDKIIAEIKRARFLIAELTYNNRGVYFESGFARGLGIPVFHVVREGFTSGNDKDGKKIHFDIAQVMYRTWQTDVDLEEKLSNWIESTIGRFQ
jgi:nucleoside 2-deoxyribosyltransferase